MTTRTKRIALTTLILAPVAAVALAAGTAGRADPAADIKKNSTEFAAAWNKHDAKALAAFWAADGDLIDPWGVTSVGREAVEKFFAGEHSGKGALAHSTYELKKDTVRMISPDVALEDWEVVLTGLAPPDATAPLGPQFHRVVIVRKKAGDKWPIAAARPGIPSPVKDAAAPAKTAKP